MRTSVQTLEHLVVLVKDYAALEDILILLEPIVLEALFRSRAKLRAYL